uniref:Reverse transcriptase domain-containing protein n=1 Tax=Trichuris muris TaxID=70415 RepID=A0A5S6Q8Y2_TRIMR
MSDPKARATCSERKGTTARGPAQGSSETQQGQGPSLQFTASIPTPSPVDLGGDSATNWKFFLSQWQDFKKATGLESQSEATRLLQNLDISDGEREHEEALLARLTEYFEPQRNVIYERFLFFSAVQEESETSSEYVVRLRKLASSCDFAPLTTELIRDRLVLGVHDKDVQRKLLSNRNLTLAIAMDVCRTAEMTNAQVLKISTSQDQDGIEAVHQARRIDFRRSPNRFARVPKELCTYCGNGKHSDKGKCPALGAICYRCQRKNHFARVCKQQLAKRLHSVQGNNNSEDDQSISNVMQLTTWEQKRGRWLTEISVRTTQRRHRKLRVQLDTGATCNVISLNDYKRISDRQDIKLAPTKCQLKCYNGSIIVPKGSAAMRCSYGNKEAKLNFQVVDLDQPPLLSGHACQRLGLLTVHAQLCSIRTEPRIKTCPMDKKQLLTEFQDVFTGLGLMQGDYHIEVDPSITPVQHLPRRVPVALQAELRQKIDQLVAKGVLAKVIEPTDWISNMVIVKRKQKLRLCIDPRDLNKALKRSRYQIPTIEEMLPRLSNAKIFSVLDAKDGFWQVRLDDQSSKLTTFWTPFGRYRWLRMPFGISTAPEEYQRRIHEVVEGLDGVEVIADDILVYGRGNTRSEAAEDHDKNLRALMRRARERNVKFNKDKLRLQLDQVQYMGHLLTASGVRPDPDKVRAIEAMPKPCNPQQVRSLLGCVTYLAKFLPNLSQISETL